MKSRVRLVFSEVSAASTPIVGYVSCEEKGSLGQGERWDGGWGGEVGHVVGHTNADDSVAGRRRPGEVPERSAGEVLERLLRNKSTRAAPLECQRTSRKCVCLCVRARVCVCVCVCGEHYLLHTE